MTRIWHNRKIIFSFGVFIVLASLDNAAAGVLPPLYAVITEALGVTDAALGGVTAVYFIIVALSAIFWGYRGDRQQRKPLLFWGTLLWVSMMIATGLSQTFTQFMLFQLGTAVGVGSISSVGFSVVSDIIPFQRRGLALSLWSVSQGLGGAFGALLAGVVGATDWRYPFFIIAGLGILFAILYLGTSEPQRGQAEPALTPLFDAGDSYAFRIDRQDLSHILKQRSTLWLLWQSFFNALAFGSTLWVPRWAIARVQAEGYDVATATIVGNLIITIFSVGFFFSVVAGHLGDRWQRKNRRGRVYLAMIGLCGTLPMFVLLYFTPLRGVTLPQDGNLLQLVWAVLVNLFTNPWVMFAFAVATLGMIFQSIEPPNWAAMMVDVNLPEHRGTVIGVSRLFRAVGNAISVGLTGVLITALTPNFPSPNNYALSLAIMMFFVVPAIFCYWRVSRTIEMDNTAVQETLKQRAHKLDATTTIP